MTNLLFLVLLILTQNIRCSIRGIEQCLPKHENHTLCHGPEPLNSVSNFVGLLKNSRSGYSIHQSNIWIILMHTRCHKDLKKLLCAIYAPICLRGHHFSMIFPCYELCESIKKKCLPRMRVYGFEWPSMVDCAQLPKTKEPECFQLSDKSELSTKYSDIKKQREDRSLNHTILSDEEQRNKLKNCSICQSKISLELLSRKYCESSLVIKAKIETVFNRRKNGISLRLNGRSKILTRRQAIMPPLASLLTHLQCNCPMLQGKFQKNKWLLFGDMENAQFVVKFLTKWRRRHRKFKFLINSLSRGTEWSCGDRAKLLKYAYKNVRGNNMSLYKIPISNV